VLFDFAHFVRYAQSSMRWSFDYALRATLRMTKLRAGFMRGRLECCHGMSDPIRLLPATVLFVAATLAASPVLAQAAAPSMSPVPSATPAGESSCTRPDTPVTLLQAESPDLPAAARDLGPGPIKVQVLVTVDASGNVVKTGISKSSTNFAVDQAAVRAARKSKYAPKLVNCQPVQGDYLFEASFMV
jgi:TonB family protein